MNATINAVCVDFEERANSGAPRSAVVLESENGDFENYYDCCRQLVEYIATNMDTSPDFVEQMNCVILASRSNAPRSLLNAVVRQDVWFHRPRDPHSQQESVARSDGMPQTLGKRNHAQAQKGLKRYGLEAPLSLEADSDDESAPSTVKTVQEVEVHELDEGQDGALNSMATSEEHENTGGSDAVIRDFCLLTPRSPGQLEAIQRWIQAFHQLCDALQCAPPTGYVCTRGCRELYEHLGSETESGSWRTRQRVQEHLKACQSEQCEVRTRVALRQVLSRIEFKQLEMCRVRYDLKDKKVSWARAVYYSDDACWLGDKTSHEAELTRLEKALKTAKDELVAMEGTKAKLCARMDSIRLDWRDEEAASSQDTMLHYVRDA
jgi:hypothetical protein